MPTKCCNECYILNILCIFIYSARSAHSTITHEWIKKLQDFQEFEALCHVQNDSNLLSNVYVLVSDPITTYRPVEAVGRHVASVDSCDVPRRLENLLPLRMVRTAKLEAHRVTEWRVDLRTPTRPRFVVSFVPQAPLHCCTPARHSSALGSLHTFSLQRTSHTPRTLPRRESILFSLSLSLSLSRSLALASTPVEGYQRSCSALTGAPISLGSRREREGKVSFDMREIVHLQAGQCGNQIGAKVGCFTNTLTNSPILILWRRTLHIL